ncbi:hypothetical protein D7X12_11680 [Corallococcus sicarius]|uniref:Uncharacterized protein n=1 Tax=Corallococcus sicarius TaxID=2316726 RepID=A0A3A8NKD8_9BACT|nr:hypothetical protein D7X12_11680 [Corallococcus sicarius]
MAAGSRTNLHEHLHADHPEPRHGPFLGTPASWTPSGTATSNGSTFATCKATLTGIGASGSYTWALSMQ